MAIDYTNWPTSANVLDAIASLAPNLSSVASADIVSVALNAYASQIQRETGRQFVAVTEDREFDGSGTGLQYVDDYISISTDANGLKEVYIYAQPGVTSGILQAGFINEVSEPNRPKNMLQIFQGPANLVYQTLTKFPEGRSNIKITATWGYAATIPADVWSVVMMRTAYRLVATKGTDAQLGSISSVRLADQAITARDDNWFITSGLSEEWAAAVKAHRRDVTTRLARRHKVLY